MVDNLAVSAQGFRRGANRVRKQMWWKVNPRPPHSFPATSSFCTALFYTARVSVQADDRI